MVRWLGSCRQGVLDEVMQTALQVSSSLTGSFKTSADILDEGNRWSRIQGDRSVGRWAVGSTRHAGTSESTSDLQALDKSGGGDSATSLAALGALGARGASAEDLPMPPMLGSAKVAGLSGTTGLEMPRLGRQASYDKDVGEVADNGMLGVEIDVQLGQMTLRSKHLSALATDIANHPDVRMIFGDATMQASLVERAEHREVFRLVGLNHELHYWRTKHDVCPPLGDEWEREYDPADLFDSEKWIATLFEPVRKNFFDGPQPPPMQFMMTDKPTVADAEVAVLLGLHQSIGGPWKLVYLFRRLRCVHVYECVTQGREWFFSLHLTTDHRYCLRELQPSVQPRNYQYPDWWIRGAGRPYPMGVTAFLTNDIEGISANAHSSVIVVREQQHHLNISGGRERLVPSRLLYGAVPHALLDAYTFWQDESIAPQGTLPGDLSTACRGYKRMLGYPDEEDEDTMVIVEFMCTGSWTDFLAPAAHTNAPFVVQATGFPGRTVRITRRSRSVMEADFKQRQRIAGCLESLQLLVPPPKLKNTEKEDAALAAAAAAAGAEKDGQRFKIDTAVECNYEQKDDYWPCVVRRANDDGTYDLEFVDEWKWLGVQRSIDPELVQVLRKGCV